MTTTAIDDWRELATREGDGLVISLFWSKAADRVKVAIADQTRDEEMHLDIPGTCALDAFYHPFAYASGRDLWFGDAMRESLDRQRRTIAERSAD